MKKQQKITVEKVKTTMDFIKRQNDDKDLPDDGRRVLVDTAKLYLSVSEVVEILCFHIRCTVKLWFRRFVRFTRI